MLPNTLQLGEVEWSLGKVKAKSIVWSPKYHNRIFPETERGMSCYGWPCLCTCSKQDVRKWNSIPVPHKDCPQDQHSSSSFCSELIKSNTQNSNHSSEGKKHLSHWIKVDVFVIHELDQKKWWPLHVHGPENLWELRGILSQKILVIEWLTQIHLG